METNVLGSPNKPENLESHPLKATFDPQNGTRSAAKLLTAFAFYPSFLHSEDRFALQC